MTPYFSKVISVSRFPIIVGVVFIHALIISNGTDLHYFLGNVVGRIGVPLFMDGGVDSRAIPCCRPLLLECRNLRMEH